MRQKAYRLLLLLLLLLYEQPGMFAQEYSYDSFLKQQKALLRFYTDTDITSERKASLCHQFVDNPEWGKLATSFLVRYFYDQHNYDSASAYLIKHLQRCSSVWLLDSVVRNYYKDEIRALSAQYDCRQYFNDSLSHLIYNLYNQDQQIRMMLNRFPAHSSKADSCLKVMAEIDSSNQRCINYIMDNVAIPTNDLVSNAMEKIGILIVHSDEANNFKFLEPYYCLAQIGRVSWMLPEQIKQNLLWRYPRDGYSYLTWTKRIDPHEIIKGKAFFELQCLIKLLKNNPGGKIDFFLTEKAADDDGMLLRLQQYLISNGIAPGRISIEERFDQRVGIPKDIYYQIYEPTIAYMLK